MYYSRYQYEKRSNENGRSTYVETFIYGRRKSCVKRKLEFDDNVVHGVADNKSAKSSKSA
ncbi:hypothetical protein TSUD_180950 [Trifolium subterraneum]|uniref:Uncharacterized protein n=1 Tax=Trifolium subterraneum TaxID=3900 RepID=A0A2Z6P9F0_TRISU|nr:hypothetical protein TSUD_180950 [Trifolium subterraneum]